MNDTQQRLVELADQKEAIVEQLKKIDAELAVEATALGVNEIFQNPETGVVYKTIVPAGTYVTFKEIDYVRTRKEGETRGSLSMKEAEAAGFSVKG